MLNSQIVLFEEEQRALEAICEELLRDSLGKSVFLLDKNGQMLATCGDTGSIDVTSLASLVAGTVAASGGLAKLIGEEEFPVHVHEGQREHIHLSTVGPEHILTVIFDGKSSLGLVRLRVSKTTARIVEVFEKLEARSAASKGTDLFSEITDEDIENLFSDAF